MDSFLPELEKQEIKTENEDIKTEMEVDPLADPISDPLAVETGIEEKKTGIPEQVHMNPFICEFKQEEEIKIEEEDFPSLENSLAFTQPEPSWQKEHNAPRVQDTKTTRERTSNLGPEAYDSQNVKDATKATTQPSLKPQSSKCTTNSLEIQKGAKLLVNLKPNQIPANPKIRKISQGVPFKAKDGRTLKIMKVGVGSSTVQDGKNITTMIPSKVIFVATCEDESEDYGNHGVTSGIAQKFNTSVSQKENANSVTLNTLKKIPPGIKMHTKYDGVNTVKVITPAIRMYTKKDDVNTNSLIQYNLNKAASIVKVSTKEDTVTAKSSTQDILKKNTSVMETIKTIDPLQIPITYQGPKPTKRMKYEYMMNQSFDNFEKLHDLKMKQISLRMKILEQERKLKEMELEKLMKMNSLANTITDAFNDMTSKVDGFGNMK